MKKLENFKPKFENEMCEAVGLMCTCNACDKIIQEGEPYFTPIGYCASCFAECVTEEQEKEFSYELVDDIANAFDLSNDDTGKALLSEWKGKQLTDDEYTRIIDDASADATIQIDFAKWLFITKCKLPTQ